MPEVLEPLTHTTAKRGFFTAENARHYNLLARAAKAAKAANPPAQPPPQPAADSLAIASPDLRLARVLSQIDTLDEMLAKRGLDAKDWDMLTRAKERLFKAWVHLAGIPGPGNRKPAPERRQPVAAQQLTPIPAAPDPIPCKPNSDYSTMAQPSSPQPKNGEPCQASPDTKCPASDGSGTGPQANT